MNSIDHKVGTNVFHAAYSRKAPTLSAVANGEIRAATYRLGHSLDQQQDDPNEKAVVRFEWNEQGLYVLAELEDSHLVTLNRQDEQLHYLHGDVFELFVKPRDEDYYWEMYATPAGNKSTLFFPQDRAGIELEGFLNDHNFRGLEVSVERTLIGWNAFMFVPASQLTALGAGWGDDTPWTILCGRYNYNDDDLKSLEFSMAPRLSETNYHLTKEYAELRLVEG